MKIPVNQDTNFTATEVTDFIAYYNKNIPALFPRATRKALLKFQAEYPSLFKNSAEWTIDKHRKKLMDWLSSYGEEA